MIKLELQKLLSAASGKEVKIEYPADPSHGDYACNVALTLSKELGKAPQIIAQEIIDKVPANNIIGKIEIAGPGFINIFISEESQKRELERILKEKNQYPKVSSNKEKIILEYSSPNIAKPLGVHHLLSTIIGQSLYNIYTQLGYDTESINHIGDWGTQFGKLIYAYKTWGKKATIEKDPISELLKLYVKFHDEVEKNPAIEDAGRLEFKKFEEGDKENRELWQWFVDESIKEIQSTYDKIGGIHFDHTQGESFYEDKMSAILEEGKSKKIFKEGEEGAYIAEFEDENMSPLVIQKKDGATLYSTRDLATIKYRIDTFKPKKILYMVDIAQTLYFKQLFEVAARFPWFNTECVHVWFGRMHLKDGKASTRKGNVILLDEVLDEAVVRAKKIIEEKNPSLQNIAEVARIIGIGAVKYNILSQNRTTDITFDWDRMLSLEGNSAPYLQYSYARSHSILRKQETTKDVLPDPPEAAEKIRLIKSFLPKFQEQLEMAAQEYKPNILSNYLYELAQRFNSFYNGVQVVRADSEAKKKERLEIVEATSQILKNGLALLGVEVVEEM
ncbi:arginine--tRNA ligase [Candidatus Peregrinibacteria bacterium CG10_big_fil_rev_8_21_14_0_10_36_19]|nr:MAG: arginine--tRNA ligase [Candidatus Peregrinibacteria bacterium CG10_big_fil_rev_8_21_14_0_10_36_19]